MLMEQPRTKQIANKGRGSSNVTGCKGPQVATLTLVALGGPHHSGPTVTSPLGHWDGTEDQKHSDVQTCVGSLMPTDPQRFSSLDLILQTNGKENSLRFTGTMPLCHSCSVSNSKNFSWKASKPKAVRNFCLFIMGKQKDCF